MVEVVLEELTKYYGEVKAIENISLHISDKEFIALLGPSGCGKTTTLRCIAGLETPTSGNILVDGQRINDIATKDRNMAMVFQNWALYPHMTVFNNISFPLKMAKESKVEIRRKVKDIAELLQIEELLDRKPRELSGGQQQRVALGRSIVREPTVFLMDEPLSNLDAKLRVYMRAEVKALQKELGITTIYVTHDQVEAMTMTDRVALLNNGDLQQVGAAEDLYNRPTNLFVGSFIGSPPMNSTPGSLVEKNGDLYIDTGLFMMNVSHLSDIIKKNVTSNEIVFGIRSEDIIMSKKPMKDAIKAVCYITEPLGKYILVNFMIGDTIFKAEADTSFNVNPKDEIWVQFNPDKIYVFDKIDGSNCCITKYGSMETYKDESN